MTQSLTTNSQTTHTGATINSAVSPFNATTPAITLTKYVRSRYFTTTGWPQSKNCSRYDHKHCKRHTTIKRTLYMAGIARCKVLFLIKVYRVTQTLSS
jgi:hypothetical protein